MSNEALHNTIAALALALVAFAAAVLAFIIMGGKP
jgi:hypothetical protein